MSLFGGPQKMDSSIFVFMLGSVYGNYQALNPKRLGSH